jgi:hypothetical protein
MPLADRMEFAINIAPRFWQQWDRIAKATSELIVEMDLQAGANLTLFHTGISRPHDQVNRPLFVVLQ